MNPSPSLAKIGIAASMAGLAGLATSQVALAEETLLGPLSGSETALILGGTTEPTPSTEFAQTVENLYLNPLGFDGGAMSSTVCDMTVTTPCFAPLQVLTTPELIQQGPSSMTAADEIVLAVRNEFDARPDAFDADHPLTIFGYSQSATAESIAMTQLEATIPKEDLHFVFIGDPSLAGTGVWAPPEPGLDPNLVTFLDGLLGQTLANDVIDFFHLNEVLGNVTPDDIYPTTIYTLDGDGVADFLPVTQENGLLGALYGLFVTHVEYLGLTPEEIAAATTTTVEGSMITNVDIPDAFNDAAAWLSAVFFHGAADSGLLTSVFNSLEFFLTNSF